MVVASAEGEFTTGDVLAIVLCAVIGVASLVGYELLRSNGGRWPDSAGKGRNERNDQGKHMLCGFFVVGSRRHLRLCERRGVWTRAAPRSGDAERTVHLTFHGDFDACRPGDLDGECQVPPRE